jgi:ribosomal protein S18 acetylase RimI-like enzyme
VKASRPDQARVVPAAEKDLPAIAALAQRIWRECYPGIITEEQIEYMLARMYSLDVLREELRGSIRYERLLAGDEFVGFAAYGPTDQREEFKLHKFYLLRERHGRGLAVSLLEQCEHRLRQIGARRLVLNVNKGNARAIAFYRKHGFDIAESVVVDIGGGFVMDDYVMAKELGTMT